MSGPSSDLDIFQPAVLGMVVGAALGYYRGRGTPLERSKVLKLSLMGALLGAGVTVASRLIMNSETVMTSALPPPPSPIVTRGAFAGLPRPLHNTLDAAAHQHQEETKT